MSEREALIQGIINNPDDDAARLVYADWQEENGDAAHAELIRLQCRLARLPAADPDRKTLASWEAELLARPENAALTEYRNTFTRGFVENARWYGNEEDAFDFDGVPLERVLFLHAADFGDSNWPDEGAAARVAAAPWARRLRRIAFHEFSVDGEVVRALAASPYLVNLREVVFSNAVTEPGALADLLLAPSAPGVEFLMLQGDTNGWDGLAGPLARVLADPRAGRIRRLYLLALGLPGEIADVLLHSKGLDEVHISLCDRLDWLSPAVRSALQARFGAALQYQWSDFIDPYSYQ